MTPFPSSSSEAQNRGFVALFHLKIYLTPPPGSGRRLAELQEPICLLFEPGFNRKDADARMGEALRGLGVSWPAGPANFRERWRGALFDDGPGVILSARAQRTMPGPVQEPYDESVLEAAAAIAREIGSAAAAAAGATLWARAKDEPCDSRLAVKRVFNRLQNERRRREIEEATAPASRAARRSTL